MYVYTYMYMYNINKGICIYRWICIHEASTNVYMYNYVSVIHDAHADIYVYCVGLCSEVNYNRAQDQ